MTYTVVWTPSSQGDLATLWLSASDRNAVAAASDYFDEQLRVDPYADSESRPLNKRVMFAKPLGIVYQVSDDDRLVTVLGVWRTDRRRPKS